MFDLTEHRMALLACIFVTVTLSVGTGNMWFPADSAGHPSFSSEQYWKETQVLREFGAFQISARRAGKGGQW